MENRHPRKVKDQRLYACVTAIVFLMLITPASAAPSCNRSLAEVFRTVAPSVVRVLSMAIDPYSLTERVRMGTGSGVVIDDDGHIVTNAHTIYGARQIAVAIDNDSIKTAKVVGIDLISDLAVVKLESAEAHLTKAKLGSSKRLEVGEKVLAVGYPFGLEKTATQGIISGTGRVLPLSTMSWLTPMLQTDAAISPGNSGGPLVNLCGQVVGINTLMVPKGQNVNFAIPIDTVKELVPQLVAQGRVIRPWHGIHGRLVPPMLTLTLGVPPGFLVETVEPGSPAEKAGLRAGRLPVAIGVDRFILGGDVITQVNDQPLKDMATVMRVVQELKVGDRVKLQYRRGRKSLSVEVVLPERPVLPGDTERLRQLKQRSYGK